MNTLQFLSAAFIALFTPTTAENSYRIGYVDVLQVKNERLLPILDDIIEHEKSRDYYMPKMNFFIRGSVDKNSITSFQIEASRFLLIDSSDDNYYKGCFKYGGHWFFVVGEEINESVFAKTGIKEPFTFYPPAEKLEDGTFILYIYEDDTCSIWIYQYINNDFVLKEKIVNNPIVTRIGGQI